MASSGDGIAAIRAAPVAAVYVFVGQLLVMGIIYGSVWLLPFVSLLFGMAPAELAGGVAVRGPAAVLFVVCYFSVVAIVAMVVWTPLKGAAVHAMATALREDRESTTEALAQRWRTLVRWGAVAGLASAVVARFLPPVARAVRRVLIGHEEGADGRAAAFVLPALALGDATTIDDALDESDRRNDAAGGFPPVSVLGIVVTFVLVMGVWTGTLSFGVASSAIDREDPLVFAAAFYGSGATLVAGIAGTFLVRTAVRTCQYVDTDRRVAEGEDDTPEVRWR